MFRTIPRKGSAELLLLLQLGAGQGVTSQDQPDKETPDENDLYPNRVGHIACS